MKRTRAGSAFGAAFSRLSRYERTFSGTNSVRVRGIQRKPRKESRASKRTRWSFGGNFQRVISATPMRRPARKTHHVVPAFGGGWNVRKGGSQRASKHFESKSAAIAYGKQLSSNQGSDLFIHKKDGTIQRMVSAGSRSTASDRTGKSKTRA
jgi:hypothetical protein